MTGGEALPYLDCVMSPPMAALLADIEAFLEASGISESAFGTAAINDKHLIRQMRDGRELKYDTEQRIRSFMARYREAA